MNLTKREVKGRYSQSFFGVAWAIAQPLATMAVFTLVFSRLAKMPSDGRALSAVRVRGARALVLLHELGVVRHAQPDHLPQHRHQDLLSRGRSSRSRRSARGFIDFFAAAALYALLMVYYGVALGVVGLMAPVFFLLLILFTVGLTFATSAVNVFYRDVNPVVQIALQLWLYLTPVAYPLAAVPARFRLLFILNPLSAIVEGFRAAVVFNRAPDWPLTPVPPRSSSRCSSSRSSCSSAWTSTSPTSSRWRRSQPSSSNRSPSAIAPAARARSSIWSRPASTGCAAGATRFTAPRAAAIDATIWALRDVSFEVPEGAGLGVIGRNGAGKTTLLKLISRVTWPTSGRGARRRPRRLADRAGRRLSPRADRPRERLPRRRPVRPHAARDRSPVRRDRRVRRRRAAHRHADEALFVGPLRAARLQRRHSQQSRHRAGGRGARGRRRRVPAARARSAAPADRRGQDRAVHLARHVERAPAVRATSSGWRRAACAPMDRPARSPSAT